MPSELMGLPLHPLAVHLPVVLVPLLCLLVIAYVLVPPLRRHVGWAVFLLSIAAPLSVYLARLTGERLAADMGTITQEITNHARHSEVLIWMLIALAPITWLFGALERARRSARDRAVPALPAAPAGDENGEATKPMPRDDDPAAKGRRVVMTVLGLLMLGLVFVSVVYLFRAGDSGARMVWLS